MTESYSTWRTGVRIGWRKDGRCIVTQTPSLKSIMSHMWWIIDRLKSLGI